MLAYLAVLLLAAGQFAQSSASCASRCGTPPISLAYAERNPKIAVVSTGVVMGETLWIGAASSDGIGYQPLARPASGAR